MVALLFTIRRSNDKTDAHASYTPAVVMVTTRIPALYPWQRELAHAFRLKERRLVSLSNKSRDKIWR